MCIGTMCTHWCETTLKGSSCTSITLGRIRRMKLILLFLLIAVAIYVTAAPHRQLDDLKNLSGDARVA